MVSKIIYRTSATATGSGRDGKSRLDDGSHQVDLVVPKELGGPGGDGLNPEKLFALGYSACFMGAMRHYAASQKIEVPDDAAVTVEVGIGPRDDTGFGLDVEIKVSLPGMDRDVAQSLIEGGHEVCPYSHATGGTLKITPSLV